MISSNPRLLQPKKAALEEKNDAAPPRRAGEPVTGPRGCHPFRVPSCSGTSSGAAQIPVCETDIGTFRLIESGMPFRSAATRQMVRGQWQISSRSTARGRTNRETIRGPSGPGAAAATTQDSSHITCTAAPQAIGLTSESVHFAGI